MPTASAPRPPRRATTPTREGGGIAVAAAGARAGRRRVPRAAAGRAAHPGPVGDAWPGPGRDARSSRRCGCRCLRRPSPPSSRWSSGCRWPGCSPGPTFPGPAAAAGPGHRCRWCCRRSSAASRCCSRSAAAASSGSTWTRGSASRSRSPRSAVVIAETFVAMPFLIVTVEGALRSADRGFEEAAATLGASRLTVVPPGHPAR